MLPEKSVNSRATLISVAEYLEQSRLQEGGPRLAVTVMLDEVQRTRFLSSSLHTLEEQWIARSNRLARLRRIPTTQQSHKRLHENAQLTQMRRKVVTPCLPRRQKKGLNRQVIDGTSQSSCVKADTCTLDLSLLLCLYYLASLCVAALFACLCVRLSPFLFTFLLACCLVACLHTRP